MPPSIQCVAFQTTFFRAIQWLAGREITYELPENSPKKNKISLRPFELVYLKEDGWKNLFNKKNLDGWIVKCRPEDQNKEFWKINNEATELHLNHELLIRFKDIRIREK